MSRAAKSAEKVRRKCTTRALAPPPHRSPTATYAARHEDPPPRAQTCSLPPPAVCPPSRQTPPNAAARVLREFFAWPAARLVARGVLRLRAALACDSSSGAPTPGGLAAAAQGRSPTHRATAVPPRSPRTSLPACRRCLSSLGGAAAAESLRSQAGGGGPAGGCAQLAAWRGRRGRRLCSRRSARRDDAATAICA